MIQKLVSSLLFLTATFEDREMNSGRLKGAGRLIELKTIENPP